VLDWQREGLAETLATLRAARMRVAGAGTSLAAARAPAVLPLTKGGRVLVFAAATGDAGVPESWAATGARPGVHRLRDLGAGTVARIAADVRQHRRAGDVVVFSVHWGGNWGYAIASAQRAFAHALVDEAGVDVVHGHSSHHPKAIEVHHGHLILYGCGDFLNDYEGIEGHGEFRGELGLMYFPQLDAANGRLRELTLVPTRIRRFRVNAARDDDRQWLLEMLRRECGRMGCDVVEAPGDALALRW
jgi:poly-gamma-glutamate synthesis protein (capsule biosynthesis protein)